MNIQANDVNYCAAERFVYELLHYDKPKPVRGGQHMGPSVLRYLASDSNKILSQQNLLSVKGKCNFLKVKNCKQVVLNIARPLLHYIFEMQTALKEF